MNSSQEGISDAKTRGISSIERKNTIENPVCKLIRIGKGRVMLINLPPFGRRYRMQLGDGPDKVVFFQYSTFDRTHVLWEGMRNDRGEISDKYTDDTPLLKDVCICPPGLSV